MPAAKREKLTIVPKLSHDDDFAKYKHVRQRVLEMVGSMSPGERLPPERKLSADFDVARETLRRGLDDLTRDGYLERRLGAGTFVATPKITMQIRVTSFTEDMRQRGLVPSSRVVASTMAKAGAQLGNYLKISPAEEVITIKRLRLADGLPMAIETLSTPRDLVPGLDCAQLENRSFYEILASRYGRSVVGTNQTIEATVTNKEASALLDVPHLSPALSFERTSWSTDQRIVEHVHSVYRGDRYKFEIESVRQPSPTAGDR
jgi:GntR family transcriptional regulator